MFLLVSTKPIMEVTFLLTSVEVRCQHKSKCIIERHFYHLKKEDPKGLKFGYSLTSVNILIFF